MPSAGPDLGTLQRPRNVEGAAVLGTLQKVEVVVAQSRPRAA